LKILIDHPNPFLLAHGGFQIQIEETKRGLEEIGLEVEWLRWWDCHQSGDIIHYFGRPNAAYIDFAHSKGMKVVISELLTGLGSRSGLARALQKSVMCLAQLALPNSFTSRMAWEAYTKADACIALTPWEASLMTQMFGAPTPRLFVVPNGVEREFFESPKVPRESWLVCTATVTQRKRVVELAKAAVLANVPVRFLGSPYSEQDPYFKEFSALSQQFPSIILYQGSVNHRGDLARIYRQARGFVLLSSMESLSLSALEAAACETPLLLSDLPWARTSFDHHAWYCDPFAMPQIMARKLREFYEASSTLAPAPKPLTWNDIALKLKEVYESVSVS